MYESQVQSIRNSRCVIRVAVQNYNELGNVFGTEFSLVLESDIVSRLLSLGISSDIEYCSNGIFILRFFQSEPELDTWQEKIIPFLEFIKSYIESEPVNCSDGRAYLKILLSDYSSIIDRINMHDIMDEKTIIATTKTRMNLIASTAILDELREGNLMLAFQPVNLLGKNSENIVFYNEALLRRHSPETNSAHSWPSAIEALENTGLISRLDFSVIWTVIRLLSLYPTQYIGCNISALTLNDTSQWDVLLEYLSKSRKIAQRLTFEITETTRFIDIDISLKLLTKLKKCGIAIAIDDFGSGHTTVELLSKIKPDIVKIDRSILLRSRDPHYSPDLLKNLTRLCHDYSPCVVVEGIESYEELAAAKYAGAQCVQGFLIQRPETIPQWLDPHRAIVTDIAAFNQSNINAFKLFCR